MAWYLVSSWTPANSTGSPVGPPIPAGSLGGYVDPNGQWQLRTDGTALCVDAAADSKWTAAQLIRPSSEATVNSRVQARIKILGGADNGNAFVYAYARYRGTNASPTGYVMGVNLPAGNSTGVQCYPIVSGSLNAGGGGSANFNPFTQTDVDLQVDTTDGSTVISVWDATNGGALSSGTLLNATQFSTPDRTTGINGLFTSGPNTASIMRVDTFTDIPPSTTTPTPTPTPVAVAPNDPGFTYQGRFAVTPTAATAINCGSAIDCVYTGDTCTANFDTSANSYPVDVIVELDGVKGRLSLSGSTNSITLTPAYTSTTAIKQTAHSLKLVAAGINESQSWSNPNGAFVFKGLTLGSGGAMLPPPPDLGDIEFIGDSITASVRLLYTGGASDQSVMDGFASWPAQVARKLGLKPRVVGFGGTGVTVAGSGGVPATPQSFPYVFGTTPYNPATKPVVAFLYLGTNDVNSGATASSYRAPYKALLQQIRAAYPAAVIFAAVPLTCGVISPAILGAVADLADPAIVALDYSTAGTPCYTLNVDTADSIGHVNPGGAAKLAAQAAADIRSHLATLGIKLQAPTTGGAGVSPADVASIATATAGKFAFDAAGNVKSNVMGMNGVALPTSIPAANLTQIAGAVTAVDVSQASGNTLGAKVRDAGDLTDIDFGMGAVQSSPAPTVSSFAFPVAQMPAPTHGYKTPTNPMLLIFQTGQNRTMRRQVVDNVNDGTTNTITTLPFPVAPAAGDAAKLY